MVEWNGFFLKFMPSPLFLENGLFRFTQPKAFEDEQEALPDWRYESFAKEDYEVAASDAEALGIGRDSPKDILETALMYPFPAHRFTPETFPGLFRMDKEPFKTEEEHDTWIAKRAVELCQEKADKEVGIFSLTKVESNLMWKKYGGERSGVMICFDADHPFFQSEIREVEYTESPISVSVNSGWVRIGGQRLNVDDVRDGYIERVPPRLLFQKRLGWAEEREWRRLELLENAEKQVGRDYNGHDVYLFRVPAESIVAVFYGSCAADEMVREGLHKIEQSMQWQHVHVFKYEAKPDGERRTKIR